ncbi:hypothetical protein D9615_003377 [Tricholomella constricta]|uniref:Alpha/beta hydrolase fold-3 domain-containing protein n=1 Tax=Tricholomella constricta TaxID=117010 RepID=A0A8H5HJ21_9AGAR|nr:hypothetical protein D9615_003377 [Tricholomella constricta]
MQKLDTKHDKQYGRVSWTELATIVLVLGQLPSVLLWSFFKSTFTPSKGTHKSWRRNLGDTAFRFVAGAWNIRQLQYCFGTTQQVYEKWARQNGLPVLVDELKGEDARLLWIGPRRTDRVVLYFHGGGYVVPMQDFAASFWNYTRLELGRRHLNVGVAVLNYSIVPTVTFPAQLKQAVKALQYVIASGCKPENIQIVGDSAGGNLALALLAHLLRPVKGVTPISLASEISGVYLMSPWVSLAGGSGSFVTNDSTDVVGASTFAYCGRKVFAGVPDSLHMYLEVGKAPASLFNGVQGIVDRILVTAGGAECLRDDIAEVASRLSVHHGRVRFIVQENGVHNDPFYDFLVGEPKLSDLTPEIVNWLEEGFRPSSSKVEIVTSEVGLDT